MAYDDTNKGIDTLGLDNIDYSKLSDIEQQKLDEKLYELLKEGYVINQRSPKVFYRLNVIKYGVKNGNSNLIDYLDYDSTDENYIKEMDEIIKYALFHEYKFTSMTSEYVKQYRLLIDAIKKGRYSLCYKIDESKLTEEEKKEFNEIKYMIIDKDGWIPNPTVDHFMYAVENHKQKLLKYYFCEFKDHTTLMDQATKKRFEELVIDWIDSGYFISNESPIEFKKPKFIFHALSRQNFELLIEPMAVALESDPDYLNTESCYKLIYSKFEELKEESSSNLLLYILKHIDDEYKDSEFIELNKTIDIILNAYGKIDTLHSNPNSLYVVAKYVYPIFGVEECVNILKYETDAAENIMEEVRNGNVEYIKKYYYDIVLKIHNIGDKTIHWAFRRYPKVRNLIMDIIDKDIKLSDEDYTSLERIINSRIKSFEYSVNSYSDLKDDMQNQKSIIISKLRFNSYDSFVRHVFGTHEYYKFYNEVVSYQITNIHKLEFIYSSISKSDIFTEEELKSVELTPYELKMIVFIGKIVEFDKSPNLSNILINYINNHMGIPFFQIDYEKLINKIRKMYCMYMNTRLTRIDSLKSKRTKESSKIRVYEDVSDLVGHEVVADYEIIDLDGEDYNFISHTIFDFDPKFYYYMSLLTKNPKLWTKLDGATTISVSTMSSKGNSIIDTSDESGVVYVFDELENDFLLFMGDGDIRTVHGGHSYNSSCRHNQYYDFDTLVQKSVVSGGFNEIAGKRKGMMPKGIVITTDSPTETQIRAAYYFKIPIIRINERKYIELNTDKYCDAKKNIVNNFTNENIDAIFYCGKTLENDSFSDKYKYCINILNKKYYNGEISNDKYLYYLLYLRTILGRFYGGYDCASSLMRDLQYHIDAFNNMSLINDNEIIKLEELTYFDEELKEKIYYSEIDNKKYLMCLSYKYNNRLEERLFIDAFEISAKLRQLIGGIKIPYAVYQTDDSYLLRISVFDKKEDLSFNFNTNKISTETIYQMFQEFIVDYFMCNRDCFCGNYFMDKQGNIIPVRKDLSLYALSNEESLNPKYIYGSSFYDKNEKIYGNIFGGWYFDLHQIDFSPVEEYLNRLENISDEEYRELFRIYLEHANYNESEKLLDKIVQRKHDGLKILREYFNSIKPKYDDSRGERSYG